MTLQQLDAVIRLAQLITRYMQTGEPIILQSDEAFALLEFAESHPALILAQARHAAEKGAA